MGSGTVCHRYPPDQYIGYICEVSASGHDDVDIEALI